MFDVIGGLFSRNLLPSKSAVGRKERTHKTTVRLGSFSRLEGFLHRKTKLRESSIMQHLVYLCRSKWRISSIEFLLYTYRNKMCIVCHSKQRMIIQHPLQKGSTGPRASNNKEIRISRQSACCTVYGSF